MSFADRFDQKFDQITKKDSAGQMTQINEIKTNAESYVKLSN